MSIYIESEAVRAYFVYIYLCVFVYLIDSAYADM